MGEMDETNEVPVAADSAGAQPAGADPAARSSAGVVPAGPETETPTPVAGTSAAPAGPMPLSMPPFTSEQRPAPSGALAEGAAPPADEPPTPNPPSGVDWSELGAGDAPPPAHERPTRRRTTAVAMAAVALLAGGLGAGLGVAFGGGSGSGSNTTATLPKTSSSSAPLSAPGTVSRIAALVDPAVVDIQTTLATPVGQGVAQAAGTGMIVTASGEVLTNNHVVQSATSIFVSIEGRTGRFKATVLGVDPVHDVALLQIQGLSNLPTVSLGDSSSVAVGDTVVAIGNALGLGGSPSVVSGIVSALNRTITASDATSAANSETLHGLIQTDAQISPGDSGGPLVNSRGQVIGMDTAAASADGTGASLGFAIPINHAVSIITQIEKGKAGNGVIVGESPVLGVTEQPVFGGGFGFGLGPSSPSGSGSSGAGVTIGPVVQGGPAGGAGLSAGDAITAIDGHTTNSWVALEQAIAAHKPGDTVSVSYTDTNGGAHTVSLTLAGIPK